MTVELKSSFEPHAAAANAVSPDCSPEITRRLREASPRAMAEATRRSCMVHAYLRGAPHGGAPPTCHVSKSTFSRWLAAYRAAEKACGCGMVGLIPRLNQRSRAGELRNAEPK
jgi:hypothetical protein